MFGISFGEMFIVLLVGLIVIGPSKLPEVARFVGQTLSKARKSWESVKNEFDAVLEVEEMKQAFQKAETSGDLPLLPPLPPLEKSDKQTGPQNQDSTFHE